MSGQRKIRVTRKSKEACQELGDVIAFDMTWRLSCTDLHFFFPTSRPHTFQLVYWFELDDIANMSAILS